MFITTNCINRYVSCTCTKFLWRHVHASVDGWLIIVLLVVYMCCAYWTNFPVTRDTHMDVQYAHNCSFGLLFSYFLMTGCFIFCHPQTQAEKKKKTWFTWVICHHRGILIALQMHGTLDRPAVEFLFSFSFFSLFWA